MKIYLAAKFSLQKDMRSYRDFLVNDGHEVTSRWIDVEHENDEAHTVTDAMRVGYAKMDVDDVRAAEVLVAFAHKRGELHPGGGRHVEFGIALQAGKTIIVVGPKGEHIFHWCDSVVHVGDIDELAALLHGMDT